MDRLLAEFFGIGLKAKGRKSQYMPPRSPDIPAYKERILLQSLRNRGWRTSIALYPAGKTLIKRMVVKGWIEKGRGLDNVDGYRITPAGEAALVRKIPSAVR